MDPDIALFVDVVREGSLAGAARLWRLSPAMVSKRIAGWRVDWGYGCSTVRPAVWPRPRPGPLFHTDVAPLVAGLRAAEARVAQKGGGPAGPLRISAPTSFGRMWIAPYLTPFSIAIRRSGFARSDRRFRRHDRQRHRSGDPDHGDATFRAGSASIGRQSPNSLREPRLSRPSRNAAKHHRPRRPCTACRAGPVSLAPHGGHGERESRVETSSSEVVRELVLGGAGIALRSLWDVGDALADGRLVRVLPAYEGSAAVGIWALHAAAGVPVAVGALLDHLREVWRDAEWTT